MTLPAKLVTGNGEVDAQHEALLHDVHALRAGATMDAALRALEKHFTTHFAAEEALMEQVEYPDRYLHRHEHLGFFDTFVLLRARWQAGRTWEARNELVRRLEMWVEQHVLEQDVHFVTFLRGLRT